MYLPIISDIVYCLQVFEVIGAVYQYIKLLKQSEPQEWIFKELQDIGNMEFRFAEEQPPDDYAVDLAGLNLLFSHLFLFSLCSSAMFTEIFSAENMLFYSEKHIVCGEYIHDVWDPELVKHTLCFFNPDNMRVDVLSRSFDKQSQGIMMPFFVS
jgi:nardilysin